MADEITDRTDELYDEMREAIRPIERELSASRDYKDFDDRLLASFDKISIEPYQNHLAQALTVSAIWASVSRQNGQSVNVRRMVRMTPARLTDYLQRRGYRITFDAGQLAAQMHDRAFTVAKVTKLDLLQDIHREVALAMKDGKTFAEFRTGFDAVLSKHGWANRKEVIDPVTGRRAMVNLSGRAKVIFQTNMHKAYQTVDYNVRLGETQERPFWQYRTQEDDKVRDEHQQWQNKVFRWDDPFWNMHHPPNGYNCRCYVVALTPDEVRSRGLEVEGGADIGEEGVHPHFQAPPSLDWEPNLGEYDPELRNSYIR